MATDRQHQAGGLIGLGPVRPRRHLEADDGTSGGVAQPYRRAVGDRDGVGAGGTREHPVHAGVNRAPTTVDEFEANVHAGYARVIQLNLRMRVPANGRGPRAGRYDVRRAVGVNDQRTRLQVRP